MATATKVWTKEEIRDLLERSNKMVHRSIVKIFERQTEDEKSTEATNHNNGVGFNSVDAQLLSSFAKQILEGRSLSPKQLEWARKKLPKYSNQLAKIANGVL